jgi:membrane fusion protein (multidrug efflux system)
VEKTTMNVRWTGAVLALAVAVGLTGCGGAEADAASEAAVRIINVEVTEIATSPFVDEVSLTGTAMANRDVQVSAEESGVIREILEEKGSRVSAGEPLAKIDDAILTAQVEQARAQAEFASQVWERRKRLWEESQVGSEIAYLEAKVAAEQAAANLRILEERLARTTVSAPFDGVLESRTIEVGSMVGPGMVVARIVDLDPIKIVAGVPERYAADVRVGSAAVVTFDVFPGETFDAVIRYVGSTVDPQNRTFPIEVVMANPRGIVKPDMVSNVAVTRRRLDAAMVVPQDALVRVENGYVVFVVAERDGATVAEVRPIEIGPTQRNLVVVEGGLQLGDRLIVVCQKMVADGDRVNVVGTR